MRNCSVSNNRTRGHSSGHGGGGIGSDSVYAVQIINSTVSGNFSFVEGGGVLNNGSILIITNSTFVGNSAGAGAWGIDNNGGTLDIGNTILFKVIATGANILNSNSGVVTSHGYNLSSDDGSGFLTATGDQINTDPLLGPLQDNGGPTLTCALLPGSPAIDAGDPNFTPPPLYDQRGPGFDRVGNGRIDIGSYEVQTPFDADTDPDLNAEGDTNCNSHADCNALPDTVAYLDSGVEYFDTLTGRNRGEGDDWRIYHQLGNAPKTGGSAWNWTVARCFRCHRILWLIPSSNCVIPAACCSHKTTIGRTTLSKPQQLVALGLALDDPKESGMVATLPSGGSYTAILAGKNGGIGVGLVEIYDTDVVVDSQLANMSTRGFVETNNNVMIGGFILGGSGDNTAVVVRGVGPSLGQFGLSNVLANPTLELYDDNGVLLISNDDWQDDAAQAAQLSALGLAPKDPNESGIFASLPPGSFTAILAGKNGGTGIGLLEIYNVR